jgi:hypothetical protein
MIYSPETNTVLILTSSTLHVITLLQKAFLKMLTLCMLVPPHHAQPALPSSYCSMLPTSLLGVDCLSSSLLGGPGPPSPPSPELTPFPSGPRQRPTLTLGTGIVRPMLRRILRKVIYKYNRFFHLGENVVFDP